MNSGTQSVITGNTHSRGGRRYRFQASSCQQRSVSVAFSLLIQNGKTCRYMGSCLTSPPYATHAARCNIFSGRPCDIHGDHNMVSKMLPGRAVTTWTVQSLLHPRFYTKQNATKMQIQWHDYNMIQLRIATRELITFFNYKDHNSIWLILISS